MRTRLLTFGVWALVSGSLLFWGMKLFISPAALPAQARLPARHVALGGDWPHLLGSSATAATDEDEAAPDEGDGHFQLLGVVAPQNAAGSRQGVALISVGGQPARAWRTGSVIEGETVLLSVSRRSVQLGPRGGPASTELSLPEPSAAAAAGGLPARVGVPVQAVLPPGVQRPMGLLGGGAGVARPQPGAKAGEAADEEEE